eukprot:4260831-Lingulodinium_polyedra.AAC.1
MSYATTTRRLEGCYGAQPLWLRLCRHGRAVSGRMALRRRLGSPTRKRAVGTRGARLHLGKDLAASR